MASEFDAMRAFVAVARQQSFRAASRSLGVSPSTVSAQVAQLESRLGTRLLERTTRSVRLTAAGIGLLADVEPAIEALDHAMRAAADRAAEPRGHLRLTATMEFGQHAGVLAPTVAAYMDRYPAVTVDVVLLDRRVDLIAEGFDLAIRIGPLPDSAMVARRLGELGGLVVCASPDYLERKRIPGSSPGLANPSVFEHVGARAGAVVVPGGDQAAGAASVARPGGQQFRGVARGRHRRGRDGPASCVLGSRRDC